MGLTVKQGENKGPSNPLWKYKETSPQGQKMLEKNERKQQKQHEASRGHLLFGIKVGDGLEFNRFKMFRLGFILGAARPLALQFFFLFFFLATWVIFTDISQSSTNKPAPSLKACLKSSYPVFEKKQSFLEVRSDVFKSRFPHATPPPRQTQTYTFHVCHT